MAVYRGVVVLTIGVSNRARSSRAEPAAVCVLCHLPKQWNTSQLIRIVALQHCSPLLCKGPGLGDVCSSSHALQSRRGALARDTRERNHAGCLELCVLLLLQCTKAACNFNGRGETINHQGGSGDSFSCWSATPCPLSHSLSYQTPPRPPAPHTLTCTLAHSHTHMHTRTLAHSQTMLPGSADPQSHPSNTRTHAHTHICTA